MSVIEPGRKAPAFTLKDQDGRTHRLSDYAGRPVVLYFYPKDDTSGCTKEACGFRDLLPQVQAEQGRGPRRQHPGRSEQGEVREEVRPELSAARRPGSRGRRQIRRLAEAVAVRPQLHGRRAHDLPDRREGKVAKRWDKVKVDGHAEEVLEAVNAL